MQKYYVETYLRYPNYQYRIYDECGAFMYCSNEKPSELIRAAKPSSILVDLYEHNITVGDIVILGTRLKGAAVAAAKSMRR